MTESFVAFADNYGITTGKNQLSSRSRHNVLYGDTIHNYQYDFNGAMKYRELTIDSSQGSWPGRVPTPSKVGLRFKEEDRYSYRGLLNRVFRTDSTNLASDWRYRYSASGEREQKRLVYTSAWDSVLAYPWVYYALGGTNEQYAVYHGQQTSGTGMCGDSGRRVYMYPTEYLTHGIAYTGVPEDVSQVITDPNGNKQFRISDHLASLRVTLGAGGTQHDDFDPWGNLLPKNAVLVSRRGFNDREKDRETDRLNLGVRSMGDGDHFTSIDPLWEKTPSVSPYAYANDNPLRMTDPTGLQAVARVLYVASVEWLKDIGGGGGGAGAAPVLVLGGLITYTAQHPEKTVPFMVNIMNDISQAMVNPIGFATNTVGGMIVASDNKKWKEQVEGNVDNIKLHLGFLEGTDGSHGSPNDPYNSDKWKKDIRKAVNVIRDKLVKLKKPFDQILKERGWSKEQIEELNQRLKDQGIDSPE